MKFRKCPNCGGEIEKGTFRSRGGNFFLPEGEKTPLWFTEKSMAKRNAIYLPPYFYETLSITVEWPEAYACRNCKIVIFPYE